MSAVLRSRAVAAGVLAAAAALLAGCASMAPPYARPEAPVAAAFPNDNAGPAAGAQSATTTTTTTTTAAAADIEWQAFFGDPRLKKLVEIALLNNRDLRVAALAIEQARGLYQVTRANTLPTVGAGATASRQPGGSGDAVSSYAVGLQVTGFELDFFGRLRSLSDVALAQYLSTEESRKTVHISLIGSVATGYLNLLADDELLRVTRNALATREDSFRLTKLKFDYGAASELDFRQAESLLEGARATLFQLQRQRAQDENALVLLLGQPLPADLPPPLPLNDQQLLPDLPAGVPSELLARRPDVRAAEQLLVAANANIGAARAAFFPSITLTANLGTASGALSGLFKSGTFAATGTAQLLQPIFDAGRNRANLEVANVNRDIALAQYDKAIQAAFREVADSLAGRATLSEQLRAQAAQANALEVTYRLADLRYRAGAASFLDVLDAQRSLFTAQQAVVQTQALQVQNLVTLYRVLGGGWSDAPAGGG